MDCNKEDAIKAKEVAETRMQSKDFSGARNMVLKAQRLYPQMENVTQMLMVCEVHCSSEKCFFENEMDWYGILQIQQTADEATIKKQYRKFALLLHPDKNKFPGAEAAFKLIGDAQRVLLDQGKRSLHDMRRKQSVPYRAPQKPSSNFNVGVQSQFRSNITIPIPPYQKPQQQQQAHPQPGFPNSNRDTFWTACPFCSVKYEYYKVVLNRSLDCQNCKKNFTAYDMNVVGPHPATNFNHTAFSRKANLNDGSYKAGIASQGNFPAQKPKSEPSQAMYSSSKNVSEKVNGKRKMQTQKHSESESSEIGTSSDESEDDVVINDEDGGLQGGPDFSCSGDQKPRRSTRQKQQVSYKENLSDDEDLRSPLKKSKSNGSSNTTTDEDTGGASKQEASENTKEPHFSADVMRENLKGVSPKETGRSERSLHNNGDKDECGKSFSASHDKSDSDSDSEIPVPEFYQYSDPDFSDFEKERKKECFKNGQIWAAYDTVDGMPRFYSLIKKVFSSPGFKVRVIWLEAKPDVEDEIKWVDRELPVSCGKFELGSSDITEDKPMFSHLVSCEVGDSGDYIVYPRKGETWALFKNWDMKWNCDEDCTNRKYEYEFVEILSDYNENNGVNVALLVKVKGFSCLFCRSIEKAKENFQVPASELFRFSHKAPSFKLTGKEREDVPEGSFELDPAALPSSLEEVSIPIVSEGKVVSTNAESCFDEVKSMMGSNGRNEFTSKEDCIASPSSNSEAYEIPDPEFHNFDEDKSPDKFQVDQIWALYSDEDGLPKYYGLIKTIKSKPEFELNLRWLELNMLPKRTIGWNDKSMPVTCGLFKTAKTKLQSYDSTVPFSHLVRADPVKSRFLISPKKGEIWALYRNWSDEIKCCDLGSCEYDIVQIVKAEEDDDLEEEDDLEEDDDDLQIEVSALERVDGFTTVFKTQVLDGKSVIMAVSQVELLRFSHQIPAFMLTEEKGGSLRGFWELDPAALPIRFFSES